MFSANAGEAGLVCVTCGLMQSQVSTDRDTSPKAGGVSFISTLFSLNLKEVWISTQTYNCYIAIATMLKPVSTVAAPMSRDSKLGAV